MHVCCIYSIKGSLYCIMHTNTNPVFMVHLTETSKLTDDISLRSYLVEHYLSIQTIIIVMIKKKSSNIGDTVKCAVCHYVACSPWDHHSDSSLQSVKVEM